jgi:hypothetical protein
MSMRYDSVGSRIIPQLAPKAGVSIPGWEVQSVIFRSNFTPILAILLKNFANTAKQTIQTVRTLQFIRIVLMVM